MKALVIMLMLLTDAISAALAWWSMYLIRVESGFFKASLPVEIVGPILLLNLYWWFLLLVGGMYRLPISLSRFDEMVRCFKAAALGIIILFIATFETDAPVRTTRIFLLNYGLLMFIFMAAGRVSVRTFQRKMRKLHVGLWNAVIVGYNDIGKRLHDQMHFYPVWGFKVIGFIHLPSSGSNPQGVHETEHLSAPLLGGIEDLPDIIRDRKIEFVLVAPESQVHEALLQVFDRCMLHRLRFMIVADYYQMVVGLVRTLEIHGLPLVEVTPQLVPLHIRFIKRFGDIIAAVFWIAVLVVVTPFVALAIKVDSPGPVFYRQRRIGKGGREFSLYKFRSMVRDAEKFSGAVWAQRNDSRVTRVGRFLRRTHLDEIPQFYNVLIGDMSLVGPRPERPVFVEEFKSKIPLYDRRMRIRPGITGWAQVRHKYDESFKDVKEKTRYDIFYIDHLSIALDLKIILLTIFEVLKGEGH